MSDSIANEQTSSKNDNEKDANFDTFYTEVINQF